MHRMMCFSVADPVYRMMSLGVPDDMFRCTFVHRAAELALLEALKEAAAEFG